MRASASSVTRFRPASIAQAKFAKLCITPLGMPVVPEVYMMVARSAPSRSGLPGSGAVRATISSQRMSARACASAGDSGKVTHGRPAGTPGRMVPQSSSLPRNSRRASQCCRICAMVPAASVGYSGTDTQPAIQIAKSAIIHQAQFFDRIAMREPGSQPCCCRKAAMRRDSSTMSFQVNSFSSPPPMGCVNTVRSGAVRSQW